MAEKSKGQIQAKMANKLSMKLMVNKKTCKVLFAEAGKDVVDFIFTFLALPLGTVIRLLSNAPMPGCIDTLYRSVQTLEETHIEGEGKNFLLHPKTAFLPRYNNQTLLLENGNDQRSKIYVCGSCYSYSFYTDKSGRRCAECSCTMTEEKTSVGHPSKIEGKASGGEKGFVKGVVTYMITDDLSVSPLSTMSFMTLLNKYKVTTVSALEEKVVNMGMNEGLAILRSSFDSETVLTDVFLGN